MSLPEAIEKAKAELERLREKEAEQLERSGIRSVVQTLTVENQLLTEQRAEARERLDGLEKAIEAARQHGAMLELQLKGARARVQKLSSAVGSRR